MNAEASLSEQEGGRKGEEEMVKEWGFELIFVGLQIPGRKVLLGHRTSPQQAMKVALPRLVCWPIGSSNTDCEYPRPLNAPP